MRTRTASSFQDETIRYARHFLRGLREAGVLGCGKHFPGLGEASLDSHQDLPVVLKSWRELWLEDVRPYRTLRRELPMVMVAHCAYPSVTGDKTPASLSRKWITEILRRKIGYRGLIISDDLEMGGVQAAAKLAMPPSRRFAPEPTFSWYATRKRMSGARFIRCSPRPSATDASASRSKPPPNVRGASSNPAR